MSKKQLRSQRIYKNEKQNVCTEEVDKAILQKDMPMELTKIYYINMEKQNIIT